MLTSQLETIGSDFGLTEDCAHCILRISVDDSIHGDDISSPMYSSRSPTNRFQGRGFGIVPRKMVKEGYCDLDEDDYKQGSLCHQLQKDILQVSHRK